MNGRCGEGSRCDLWLEVILILSCIFLHFNWIYLLYSQIYHIVVDTFAIREFTLIVNIVFNKQRFLFEQIWLSFWKSLRIFIDVQRLNFLSLADKGNWVTFQVE